MSYRGEVHSAGDDLARERLTAYTRIAELVRAQEAALDADDLDRFHELAADVFRLQASMGETTLRATSPSETGGASEPTGQAQAATEAARILQDTLERSERIRMRLADLRQGVGEDIRRLAAGRSPGRRYMEAAGSLAAPSASRLDVKL